MAQELKTRRKPRPKHSATHITVWSMNGENVHPTVLSKVESAVRDVIANERLLMAVDRV